MSVLRNLEERIAGLVEGTFGRVFRAEVRPVEIAHRLAREMDLHRTVSVSRTYAPHVYAVWLSAQDRERYAPIEAAVGEELAGHLLEHARREGLVLSAAPEIRFETDDSLGLGEFGIEVIGEGAPGDVAGEQIAGDSRTMVYSTSARHQEALEETARTTRGRAVLVVEGRRIPIGPAGATIGRSRDCDVVLADSDVSRHHAQIVGTGGGWTIRDLGSTNGLRVDGRAVGAEPARLAPGAAIEIGTVRAQFEVG
ncbi:MAG: DUF3662 and FHA domain-containing protein [Baekduia sp.]